jgi:hypothetical protein
MQLGHAVSLVIWLQVDDDTHLTIPSPVVCSLFNIVKSPQDFLYPGLPALKRWTFSGSNSES